MLKELYILEVTNAWSSTFHMFSNILGSIFRWRHLIMSNQTGWNIKIIKSRTLLLFLSLIAFHLNIINWYTAVWIYLFLYKIRQFESETNNGSASFFSCLSINDDDVKRWPGLVPKCHATLYKINNKAYAGKLMIPYCEVNEKITKIIIGTRRNAVHIIGKTQVSSVVTYHRTSDQT